MSDRPAMDACHVRGGSTLGVLVVVAVGILAWSGCGDDRRPGPTGSELDVPVVKDRSDSKSRPGVKDSVDGSPAWASEDFNLAAGRQLHLLVADLESDGQFDPDVVARLASADFRGGVLRPESMTTVHESEGLSVRRHVAGDSGNRPGRYRGVEGLVESLRELVPGWDD